jgi:hypothetical protein
MRVSREGALPDGRDGETTAREATLAARVAPGPASPDAPDNPNAGWHLVRHKLATAPIGTVRKTLEFCGLQREGILWQEAAIMLRYGK